MSSRVPAQDQEPMLQLLRQLAELARRVAALERAVSDLQSRSPS